MDKRAGLVAEILLNTGEIHPTYQAVSLSGPAWLQPKALTHPMEIP